MVQQQAKITNPLKIMLADDNKVDQDIFRQALRRTQIFSELITAQDGEQLMEMLTIPDYSKPDMIFLDVDMHRKNGIECLREIKSSRTLKNVPCIMLTSSDDERNIKSSYNIGANLYVIKPESFPEMIDILKSILAINWQEYKQDSQNAKAIFSSSQVPLPSRV